MGGILQLKAQKLESEEIQKDFGHGFYCTIIKNRRRDGQKRYDTGIVSIYDVRFKTNLHIKNFEI